MKNNNNNLMKVAIILTSILIAGAAYSFLVLKQPAKKMAGTSDLINEKNQASIGGEFELTDHNGQKFSSKNLKGKYSLVYFGFTYCPDICPAALNKVTEVLEVMDKYKVGVNTLFITVDPKRDNEESLKSFLSSFHPSIIGLTGSEEQIKAVADKFKVYYALDANSNPEGKDYLLNHSSFIYILDEEGKYVTHFASNSEAKEMIDYLRINAKRNRN